MPNSTLPLFPAVDPATLQQPWLDRFERWVAARSRSTARSRAAKPLSDESATVYREIWGALAAYCAERSLALQAITAGDLDNFLASRGGADDISTRHAWRVLALVDKVARFDAKEAGVTPNGAARELLQTGRYRYANTANHALLPDFLTAGEARRLIEHVTAFRGGSPAGASLSWQEIRNRTAVAVQLGGGLSPGDVRGLPVTGVVIDGGRVAGLPWKLILTGNGNSPARESPLAAWAGRQLALWLAAREEQRIAGELVFPSTRTGKPWSKVSSYLAFKAVFEAAGLADPAGGSYKLRHTFALRQLKKGKSAEDVARWLGVQDPAVIERYRRVLIAPVDVV